jgi:hypothetical protein
MCAFIIGIFFAPFVIQRKSDTNVCIILLNQPDDVVPFLPIQPNIDIERVSVMATQP